MRAVVDAGLARVPRTDLARGLGSLVTVPVSRASAQQRAGRAGREAPGRVYRCWSAAEHERLPAARRAGGRDRRPDRLRARAGLLGRARRRAAWRCSTRRRRPRWRSPARCCAGSARSTTRGASPPAAGRWPPSARTRGWPARCSTARRWSARRRAAEVVAVLVRRRAWPAGDDLAAALRGAAGRRDRGATARWRDEVRRLERAGRRTRRADRRARRPRRRAGRRAGLPRAAGPAAAGAPARRTSWPAAPAPSSPPARPDRRRVAGGRGRRPAARAAATRGSGSRSPSTRRPRGRPAPTLLRTATRWPGRDGDVRARRGRAARRDRAARAAAARPDPARSRRALPEGLRREGLGLLRWTPAARELRGSGWPPAAPGSATRGRTVDDAALLRARSTCRAPAAAARPAARSTSSAALRALLPWQVAGRLDEVAPERVEVPSGSRVRVDYTDPDAPGAGGEGAGGVRLGRRARRSPAARCGCTCCRPRDRVVAVTSDLASFWATGYPGVRAELRGRYPRHAWPEDPATAPPTDAPGPPALRPGVRRGGAVRRGYGRTVADHERPAREPAPSWCSTPAAPR